jgi:hypothetical protein
MIPAVEDFTQKLHAAAATADQPTARTEQCSTKPSLDKVGVAGFSISQSATIAAATAGGAVGPDVVPITLLGKALISPEQLRTQLMVTMVVG